MRLLNSLTLAGLAGLASASAAAEVYILSKDQTTPSSSSTPYVPRQVAKQIFVQRLGGEAQFPELHDVNDLDQALSHIAQFGKSPKPLLGGAAAPEVAPSQLLVMFEGVTSDKVQELKRQLQDQSTSPAFTIPDAPSHQANVQLLDVDLTHFSKNCDVTAAINPYDSCWEASLAVKFDLKHDHTPVQILADNFHVLRQHIAAADIEAVILLVPESTRAAPYLQWATGPSSELRRRGESVLTVPQAKVVVAPGSGAADVASSPVLGSFAEDPSTSPINLGCFTTAASCEVATSNCTGHGMCVDKYASATSGGQSGDRQCFVCSCKSTKTDDNDNQHTHWGGAYCQKIDISSPFWLLVGTSIILTGVVAGCIGLLFSVGEEKLPGVIGAGVSRSK